MAKETAYERYVRRKNEFSKNNSKLADTINSTKSDTNKGGLLGGIGYVGEQLGLGVVRGIEGMSDFVVGGLADLFGADDFADEVMKSDWIDYNHANEWYNPSGAMQTVGEIGQGVGAMLPSIVTATAITALSGGTAAPVAANLVSGTMLFTQAAGQATSEAAKESGTAGGKEWLYGIGSGAAETAVEMASGGIGGSQVGKVLGKQLGKTTAGKLAVSAIGEGLEEVAGDYIDVGLRRATGVEKDAKLPTAKELGKTFIVGAGVGGVLGGAGRATNAIKAGGFNNLNASENAQELTDRLTENNLRQAKGKTARYTPKDMQDTARRLSYNLQKMDAQKRKAYMDSNPFMKAYFAEDGTLLSSVGVSSSTAVNGGLSTYSASLRGREDTLAYAPSQNATETSQRAMDTVTKLTGGKAEVVLTDHDFGVTKNGKKINGEYRNGVIYLSATATDADKVNFVAHHEMAHTLEGTKEYGVLGDYIAEMIEKNPTMYAKYNLDAYKERYSQSQTEELSAETKEYEAITEIYADFIANEILSSQESVNRLANRDANIVKKFLSWVRTAIKNIGMSKEERVAYKELRRMEKLLANALDAGKGGVTLAEIEKGQRARKEAMEGVEQKTTGELATARASLSSISQSFFGEQVSLKDFESRKYKETEGYKKYVEECVSNMIQSKENLNETEVRKEIEKSIDGIVDVAVAMKKAGYDILDVGEHRKARDSKKRLLFSSLEPNSDYFTSHDISTICDKRKNFAEIYDEIVAREEKMGIPKGKRFFANVDNYFVLHDILASKGLTAACKQCYVESMRKNLAPMANAFLELMQEKNASNRSNKQLFNTKGEAKVGNTELRENLLKTIAEEEYDITADDLTIKMLTTASGLVQLKIQAPLIYEAFNSFYGQSKPKMPRQAVPFRFGELSAMLRNHNGTINQTLVKKINSTGGFRLQSYSDFQIENWADVLQVIFEAGTLGLNGHAYTKVPAFLDATEDTNLKRNISVFMYKDNEIKGVDKWRIDKKDSFPAELKDIYAIVQADASGNTGIIAVSQNDDMSAWIMANAMIAYGIPFHKSGIKMDTVRKNTVRDGKRVIEGYLGIKDHTRQQSEVWKKTEGDHKAFTRVKKAINIYEWWDFKNTDNLTQKQLIEKNVKRYIDECEKAGYYPKFRDYVMDNDGILNKIVAYSKAFGDANATVDSISFEYKGYRIPYGYYKFLGDFGMFKPNGKASPQKVLSLANYDFKKAVEYFSKPAELRREEILQQFDNETVREDYRKSDLTAEQLEEIVKQKRKEVADEIIDKRYGKNGESRLSIDMEDISDFDAITFSKWFDELTIKELQELIGEDSQTEIETIESLPTKEERRQAYIERMYKQGNLNEAITKIVKRHPQMQAYFKNTQMNQKYNPLYRTKDDEFIVMFHGTPTMFNVFDTKKIGKHGTVMGSGLYFTESLRYAEDYKTDDGRVMATLLNIEKPLSRNKITMSKEDLKRFIREVVDSTGDDYLSNYGDVYSLGYEKLLDKAVNKVYDYHTNDADMVEDIYVTSRMDFDEFHNGLTELLGYDGIIAWNKAEGTQAVVFRSNQAKDIFNFNPTKNADVRYSVSSTANQEVENALNDKNYQQEIKLTDVTPSILLGQKGVKNLPMIMKASHVRENIFTEEEARAKGLKVNKNINYHGLGKTLFLKVIDDLDNVTEAYRGTKNADNPDRRENYFLLISKQKDANENVINVPVFVNEKGLYNRVFIDSNKIATVFGREGINSYIREQISKGNLVRIKKRNAQVGESTAPIAAHYDKNVSNNIITEKTDLSIENDEKVEKNSESRKSLTVDSQGNRLTAEQQEFFKDSKVRDEDGNLLVVYHGTPNGGFTEFKLPFYFKTLTSKQGAGFYFTDKANARQYMKAVNGKSLVNKQLYEVYLNITNPLEISEYSMGNISDEAVRRIMARGNYEWGMQRTKADDVLRHLRDVDRLAEMVRVFNGEEILTVMKEELGHDGVKFTDKYGYIYVAWDKSQIKSTTNKKPTQNPDIRYSVSITPKVAKVNTVNASKQPLTKAERVENVKSKLGSLWLEAQIESTNVQAGIEHEAKLLGGDLKADVHRARAVSASAINALTNEQRDYSGKKRVGDSLSAIFTPVWKKGADYTEAFYTYLYHYHNVDRMGLEAKAQLEMDALLKADAKLKELVERKKISETTRTRLISRTDNGKRYLALLEVKNKPVFGETVTATESKAEIIALGKAHPEFKAIAEKVWKYSRNNIQYRIDAGLITQELGDQLLKEYPHYVPTYRAGNMVGSAGVSKLMEGVSVRKTIKTAKGGDEDLADIAMSLTKQTLEVYRAAAVNNVAVQLHELAKNGKSENIILMEEKTEKVTEDTDYGAELPKGEVAFYKDGERYVMAVSRPIAVGFESFTSNAEYGPIMGLAEKINKAFKTGVTSANPLFLVRNVVRDVQEALFYTHYGMGKFSATMIRAMKIMKTKGEMWQRYLAVGGLQSGYFSRETGVYDSRSKAKKVLAKPWELLQSANEFIEQIPRFAEFILAIENGKTDAEALLDSADVTTNFSRGGKLAKALNRTVMPFLNPSIQGWSKLWRTAFGKKTARQWTHLIVKALAVGLTVGMLNDLLNGDDEDYKNLNTRDKENYYIFGIGDGKFIKIPKGRVVAALGTISSRIKAYSEGDENAFDGWLESVGDMVTPVDQVTRFIWSPFTDAKTNTTWYGGQIENQAMQNLAVKDRYDEGTSSIAVWIGRTLNVSPKKVHYVIDQYSGVLGDIVLPATTKKAERDMFSAAFTIDSVTSNRISTDFYNMKDEMMYAKNGGDMYADMVYSYLNKVSGDVSDMYAQKRDIQGNSKLSDKEKLEQANIVQASINGTLQAAMINAEQFEQILMDMGYADAITAIISSKAYSQMDADTQTKVAKKFKDYAYAMAMSNLTDEKADKKYYLYNSVGATDISLYLTEIGGITADKDKQGNITTTRKEKVHKYIEHLKLSKEQKYILMYLAGYTPTEEGKKYVENYLRKNGFTAKELDNLWD